MAQLQHFWSVADCHNGFGGNGSGRMHPRVVSTAADKKSIFIHKMESAKARQRQRRQNRQRPGKTSLREITITRNFHVYGEHYATFFETLDHETFLGVGTFNKCGLLILGPFNFAS